MKRERERERERESKYSFLFTCFDNNDDLFPQKLQHIPRTQ